MGRLSVELDRKTLGTEHRVADRFLDLLSDRQQARLRKEIARIAESVDEGVPGGNGRCVHVAGQMLLMFDDHLGANDEDPIKRLPAYQQLSRGAVREELHFTEAQEKQFAKIVQSGLPNGVNRPSKDVDSGGDAASGVMEETSRSKEAWNEMRRQLSHLLTSEQATRLKECTFRYETSSQIGSFYIAEQLGLSERQKTAVKKIGQEYREQEDTMNAQVREELFGWLKPDQQKKLRQAMLEDEW